MRSIHRLLCAGSILMLASACSQGEDGANQAAAANEQAPDMNSTMNDPNNPFAQAEIQMNERMMAAVGADSADTWVRKMIEHHRGAVEMSNILLPLSQDPNVRQMAQSTIEKQTKEIQELEKLVRQGAAPAPETANLYRPSEMQMHQRMMAATGATIDETWMRKMIEHHRGAVAMSDVVLAQDPPAQIRAIAQKTRSDQMKEIEHLEAMLSGENPMAAASTAGGAEALAAKASENPKTAPAPAPKEAPEAAPRAAPKAEPVAPATPACAPEHRALGHC